jgi:hypothetical protein
MLDKKASCTLEVLVEGLLRDTQDLTDFPDWLLLSIVQVVEERLLLGRELPPSTAPAPPSSRRGQPCLSALPVEVALELSDRSEDLEDEVAG